LSDLASSGIGPVMLMAGPVATAADGAGDAAEAAVGLGAVVGAVVGGEAGGGCAAGEHATARSKLNPSTRQVRLRDGAIEQTVAARV
jgi:hypothetical protein